MISLPGVSDAMRFDNIPIGDVPCTVQVNLATSPFFRVRDFGLVVNLSSALSSPSSERSLSRSTELGVETDVFRLTDT